MCQRLYKCCVQWIAVENQIDKLVVVCIFQDNSNKELKIILQIFSHKMEVKRLFYSYLLPVCHPLYE